MKYDEKGSFGYQVHGYRNGHQLLSSTIVLSSLDQDTVDRLSDISGSIRPGETFNPYLTCYSLPSGNYYVIARTWQDITVARAGCVVTKSIIIHSELWGEFPDVFSLFKLLLSSTSDKLSGIDGISSANDQFTSGIDLQTEELVEAIFLERRQPVLVFNSTNAETISARLISAFWPELRKKFSVCTYALSPRTIQGKPFDLTFAPSSSKSKFGEWNGRRIDQGKGVARHRWTEELINSIFKSDQPTLVRDSNKVDLFYSKNTGELDLQLNLLWNELKLKAASENPFLSVLGLLDIVNSQPLKHIELYQDIYEYMVEAINLAFKKLIPSDAWAFYTSLLARHKSKLMTRELLTIIKKATSNLTTIEPYVTLNYIQDYEHHSNTIPPMLYAGIGDGLSEIFDENLNGIYNDILKRVDGQLMIALSSASENFVKSFLNIPEAETSLKSLIIEMNHEPDDSKKDKAFRNIVTFISEEYHLPLFEALMVDCDEDNFKLFISRVIKNGVLKFSGYCFTIFLHAKRLHEVPYLCQLLLQAPKSLSGDIYLGKIISEEPTLLYPMLSSSLINSRKSSVLDIIFKETTDNLVKNVLYNGDVTELLIEPQLINSVSPWSRLNILLMIDTNIDQILSMLESFDEKMLNSLRSSLVNDFFKRAFVDASVSSNVKLESIFKKLHSSAVQTLYDTAIFRPTSNDRVISNIFIFIRSEFKWRDKVMQNIDYVSSFLANNIKELGTKEMILWSQILGESKKYKHQQKEAAVHVVDFSFRAKKSDPSPLLKIAFPIVYRAFLKGKSLKNFISSVLFSDWDKCKTLRHDLVDRYMDNKWDVHGLLEVAIEADIVDEVLHILKDTKRGRKLLTQISKEFSKNKLRI